MFDTALLESRRGLRGRGRGASLPLSIGLHAAILGAFVGAAVWNIGEPPEPVTPVIFYPTSSSPPLPPGPTVRGPQSASVPAGPHAVTALVQPRGIPDELPSEAPKEVSDLTEERSGETTSAIDSDLPGGDGPPGGTGPIGGTGPLGSGVILRPGGDVSAPVIVERVEPEYPETARRVHMEGVVILEAVITVAGRVEQVRVLKTANPLLDAAAERAVRQWRYRPATLNGRAVNVYLTVTVTFGLRS